VSLLYCHFDDFFLLRAALVVSVHLKALLCFFNKILLLIKKIILMNLISFHILFLILAIRH
jgi:hypothetical protein